MQDKFLFIQLWHILDEEAWIPYSFAHKHEIKIQFSLTEALEIQKSSGAG